MNTLAHQKRLARFFRFNWRHGGSFSNSSLDTPSAAIKASGSKCLTQRHNNRDVPARELSFCSQPKGSNVRNARWVRMRASQ